jgi:hypothetical protein
MTSDLTPSRPGRSRRRLALGLLSPLVVGALVGLALLLGGGHGDPTAAAADGAATAADGAATAADGAAAAGTTGGAAAATTGGTAEPEAGPGTTGSPAPYPVTPQPTGPTDVVDEPPPSRPAVPLDQEAAAGDGVTASITSLEAIQGTGTGRGNVAGPALRVHVQITNGTVAPVSLDGVTVTMATGAELMPASPLDDPSQAPFAGTVGPGDRAEGDYVFSVEEEARTSVTLSVGYQAGAPIMVFTGPAR